MKNVYGYIRVSTDKQVKTGQGLEAQKAEILKFCAAQDLNLVRFFADEGVSGVTKEDDDNALYRPAFMDMVKEMEDSKEITEFVVYSTDRLWRNEISAYLVKKVLKKSRASVRIVTQPFLDITSPDPNDRFICTLMEAVDTYNRDSTVRRTWTTLRMKAARGEKPTGRLPMGYRFSHDGKRVEIDPDTVELVKKVFCYFLEERSYAGAAERLNEEGYRTKSGCLFTSSPVQHTIMNDFYVGYLTFNGKKVEGTHPKILTEDEWNRVQEVVAAKKRKPRRKKDARESVTSTGD